MLDRLSQRCDKLALGMFYVLMADVCIFGAGKLISVGPLSFRMILLTLTFLVSLPIMLKQFIPLVKSKYTWVIGGFCVWLVIATVIGIRNQNQMSLIITDLKGFLYFALFPVALCLICNRKRAETLTKVMMYSAAVMAILHIVCILSFLWFHQPFMQYASHAFDIHFFYVSYQISEVNVRINFLSLVCQLFGCAFSVYYQVKERGTRRSYLYAAITALCLFAILMSYTRSIYLGAAFAALGTVLTLLIRTDKETVKRLAGHLARGVALFLVIVAVFRIGTGVNYLSYGISRALVGVEWGQTADTPSADTGETDATETEGTEQEATETEGTEKEPTETVADSTETDGTEKEPTETVPDASQDALHNSTLESDALRQDTVNDLWNNIKAAPILGLGLGATISSRPGGLNEYFFLDLWSKTGIIGFGLYLAPFVFMAWELIKKIKEKAADFHFLGLWFAVMVGFAAYSYFTPCMNSSVGIMCYCCAMAVFRQAFIRPALQNKEI